RPSRQTLERVQPQRGLVVGDAAAAGREVAERRRRLRVAAGVAAIPGKTVTLGLAAQRDLAEHPRHEAAEIAQREKVQRVLLLDRARGGERVEALVHPRVLELVGADDAVPELLAGLVNGDAFRLGYLRRREPARAAADHTHILPPPPPHLSY